MDNPGAIVPAQPTAHDVAKLAKFIQQSIVEIRRTILTNGVDYGKIPGTSKDVLLKPGAEKLSSAFKLYPVPKLLTCVEDWQDGFFFYRYQIDLVHRETGEIWGSGIGSCNSREKKYAWRWVNEDELPAGIDTSALVKQSGMRTLSEFDFAVNKAETGGQYGKPAEHWQMFREAIASGKAKKVMKETKKGPSVAWELTTSSTQYRIPNPEICELVNTIDKMAFKRAYVASVLIATNASEFFTQDMEDFVNLALPDENVVEGVIEEITPPITAVKKMAEKHAMLDATAVLAQSMSADKQPPVVLHWSDDPFKRTLLVNTAIECLYLDMNDGWDALLTLAELDSDSVRKLATGGDMGKLVKQKAEALIQQKVDQRKQDELPKRFHHCVTDATFNSNTEEITFNVPGEATKDAAQFKPLVVKRSKFLAMLTAGDKGQEANGKKHAEAMRLDSWTAGSAVSGELSSHSFREIILDYNVKGSNGSTMLWLVDVTPANDLRGETVSQPTTAAGKAIATYEDKQAAERLAASASSIVADLDAQLQAQKELDPDYIPF